MPDFKIGDIVSIDKSPFNRYAGLGIVTGAIGGYVYTIRLACGTEVPFHVSYLEPQYSDE